MKAAVIIPVYNHEQRIGAVIGQALKLGLPLLVIDDGSTDSTPEIINDIPGIVVIRHPVNLGKGAAGAAVQNLNILAGLPETAGLRL